MCPPGLRTHTRVRPNSTPFACDWPQMGKETFTQVTPSMRATRISAP
jgi:hypothetical protein